MRSIATASLPYFALCVFVVVGCATRSKKAALRPQVVAPASRPAITASTQPFVLPEAPLPVGYPPPGPVGVVVIKNYPAVRVARVHKSPATKPADASDTADSLFMPLFHHIERRHIAMAAPVHMDLEFAATTQPTNAPVSMAFPYHTASDGAIEQDGDVEVVDMPAVTVLSVGVRGAYDELAYAKAQTALLQYQIAHPEIEATERYRVLAYNSPFVPSFARYSEVQVVVVKVDRPAGRRLLIRK